MMKNVTKKSNKSRFIGMLLALIFTVTALQMPIIAADIETDSKLFQNEIGLLMKLGVFSENILGEFPDKANVTRADFAVQVLKLLNLYQIGSQDTTYLDIPGDYYAKDEIAAVSSQKLMGAVEMGRFYPENFMTYGAALTVSVRALGYDELARGSLGEYPMNYYGVAQNLGITKGLSLGLNDFISRGHLAKLFANTLETDLFQVVNISNGGVTKVETPGVNILSEYHKIGFLSGQVTGNSVTTLSNPEPLAKGRVRIEERTLLAGETDIEGKLGYPVKAYYKLEEEEVIYYLTEESKAPLTISGKEIVGFQNNILEVETNGNFQKINVPYDAYIIYNNKAISSFKEDYFRNRQSNITFVDGNKDGKYDVIFIIAYRSYAIDRVNTLDGILKFKDGSLIDTNSDSVEVHIRDSKDKEVSINSLKQWDVLTEFKSDDGSFVTYIVSTEAARGKVSEMNRSGNDSYIKLDDGTVHELEQNFFTLYPHLQNGSRGNFYLNLYGEVTAANVVTSDSVFYGYLVNSSPYNEIKEEALVKIFSEDGKMITASLASKVILDGKTVAMKEASTALCNDKNEVVHQVLRYKMNDKEQISFIDTLNKTDSEHQDYLVQTFDSGNGTFNYIASPRVLDGKYFIAIDAKIFSIPSGDIRSLAEEDFSILDASKLGNGVRYQLKGYKNDQDSMESNILVMGTLENAEFSTYETVSVISKITTVVTGDGDLVHKVYYYYASSLKEALAKDDQLFKDRVTGDCVMIALDMNNRIYDYKLYFNAKTKTLNPATPNPNMTDYHALRRALYGHFYYVKGDLAAISTEPVNQNTDLSSVPAYRIGREIYFFDTERNQVRTATLADIVDYRTDPNNYCMAFVFQIYSLPYMTLIIK